MTIPIDIQAYAAECAATNQRAAVERHEHLATRKKWNADLIPGERRFAEELAAVASTMRAIAKSVEAQETLRAILTADRKRGAA